MTDVRDRMTEVRSQMTAVMMPFATQSRNPFPATQRRRSYETSF
jgi:hypothetical protein